MARFQYPSFFVCGRKIGIGEGLRDYKRSAEILEGTITHMFLHVSIA